MDAFMGTWNVDPTKVADVEELFDLVAPPGIAKEDMMKPHKIEIARDGDQVTLTAKIPGKPDFVQTHTIGKKEVKELPGGITVETEGHMEGDRFVGTQKSPKVEVHTVRYVEGDNMISEVTVNGKTWKLIATR